MRVGIFGGTFNPPHIGHLIAAEFIREEIGLDKIIFIPCARPPHKRNLDYLSQLAEPGHRLEMLKIAIKGNTFFEISDIEIKRGGISYTVDTVNQLVEMFPENTFYLLIGADQFMEFHTWKDPDEVVKRVQLIVFNRSGFAIPESRFSRFAKFISIPNIEISASMVRWRIRNGKSIKYLVPAEVEEYIRVNGLYR